MKTEVKIRHLLIHSFYYEMIQIGYLGKHFFQYFIEQQKMQNAFVFLDKRNQD